MDPKSTARDKNHTASVGIDGWDDNLATDAVADGLCTSFGFCGVGHEY